MKLLIFKTQGAAALCHIELKIIQPQLVVLSGIHLLTLAARAAELCFVSGLGAALVRSLGEGAPIHFP